MSESCCCNRKTKRDEKELRDLIARLNRIEGQVRGIKGMLEREAYCTDIMIQVSAASQALNSLNKELLSHHIKTCVVNDVKDNKLDTADELADLVRRLIK